MSSKPLEMIETLKFRVEQTYNVHIQLMWYITRFAGTLSVST